MRGMGAGAVEAYAGWAPLGRMREAGLLRAAAFLLATVDFRQPACDILTIAATRKQAQEAQDDFRAAQGEVGQALSQAAAGVLAPEASASLRHDEANIANTEFAIRLAGTMAEWGGRHLSTLPHPARTAFLQQVCHQPLSLLYRRNLIYL